MADAHRRDSLSTAPPTGTLHMASTAAPHPQATKHLLALKVLRAARPTLASTDISLTEDSHIAGDALATLAQATPLLRDVYSEQSTAVTLRSAQDQVEDHRDNDDDDDVQSSPDSTSQRRRDTRHVMVGRDFTPSSILTLPGSFGTIYLGQEFHALVSVQNEDVGKVATNVSVKVEMQTASGRIIMTEMGVSNNVEESPTSPPSPRRLLRGGEEGFSNSEHQDQETIQLEPKQGLDLTAKHEIKELGTHALICSVSYTEEVEQSDVLDSLVNIEPSRFVSRSFRKLYKFQVSNPLSVKTKVFSPLASSKAIPNAILSPRFRLQTYLEVQVTNQSGQHMVFESVLFEPNPGFSYTDLNVAPTQAYDDDEEKTCRLPPQLAHLAPLDNSQFLFLIEPKAPNHATILPPPVAPRPGSVDTLGRLDLKWRSPMGEFGRLQTSGLTRKIPLPPVAPATASSHTPATSSTPFPYSAQIALGGRPHTAIPSSFDWALDISVDMTISNLDYDNISIHNPFEFNVCIQLVSVPKPNCTLHFALQRFQHVRRTLPNAHRHQTTTQRNRQSMTTPFSLTSFSPDPSRTTTLSSSTPLSSSMTQHAQSQEMSRVQSGGQTTSLHRHSIASSSSSTHHELGVASTLLPDAIGTSSVSEMLMKSAVPIGLPNLTSSTTPPPPLVPPKSSLDLTMGSMGTPMTTQSSRSVSFLPEPVPTTPYSATTVPKLMDHQGSLIPLGASLITLLPVTLTPSLTTQNFTSCTLRYLATESGLQSIGGVRLLLLSCREPSTSDDDEDVVMTDFGGVVVKEWDVISQVYVQHPSLIT